MGFTEPTGQGWPQVIELLVALGLATLIGLERELRRKSAGLRTHALIGFSAALIMLVSKYGFTDVLSERVVLDPSRVAAQIVSGIGFIGGGLIFVKRDLVRGLTTAAAVWLTTSVGMAAGAGLPLLAALTTAGYFAVVYGFTPLNRRLNRNTPREQLVEVVYEDGRGLLRTVLSACTERGWAISRVTARQNDEPGRRSVTVLLSLHGPADYPELAAALSEIDGVRVVSAAEDGQEADPETE